MQRVVPLFSLDFAQQSSSFYLSDPSERGIVHLTLFIHFAPRTLEGLAMDWLYHFRISVPKSIKSSITSAFKRRKPSIRYLITTCDTPAILLQILTEHLEEIVADNVALAHLRIHASQFLIKEISRTLARLESHVSYYRSESDVLHTSCRGIYFRITPMSTTTSTLARAEEYRRRIAAIERISNILLQFIGMHTEAIDSILAALRISRADDLAHAIVTSCRQATTLQHLISQCATPLDVQESVEAFLQASLDASRRVLPNHSHAAGQLGQFWNQSSEAAAKRFGTHDVHLTLQLIQGELAELHVTGRYLRRVCDRGLARPSELQRRPVRSLGLAGLAIFTSRSAFVNARFLGGSGLLEDRMVEYAGLTKGFLLKNVLEPAIQFYDQVFKAVPGAANEESVAVARSSLREMLIDFTNNNLHGVSGADDLARDGSMKAVMDLIREQARNPLRNSVAGSLGQAIFLQMQKLKCDVEELMLKSKQMLRAQELNLALVALVPSLLCSASLVYMSSTAAFYWRSRGTEMIVSGSQTATFLLGDVLDCLLVLDVDMDIDNHATDSLLLRMQHLGTLHIKMLELRELVRLGAIKASSKVITRFTKDLEVLQTADISYKHRRTHVERMLICYAFLHQS